VSSDNVALNASAAILVGGSARRLGGEVKSLLPVGARTILDRQLEAIRAAGIGDIMLVGAWSGPRISGLQQVPDVLEHRGALGGLYSALLVAAKPIVVVLASDLPFLLPELLRHLAAVEDSEDAVVPRTRDGWHPLCAGYRRQVALAVKARLDRGELQVRSALDDMRVRPLAANELARIDPGGILLTNVNTPDEHRRADNEARTRA